MKTDQQPRALVLPVPLVAFGLCCAINLQSCTTWRAGTQPLPELLEQNRQSTLQVVRADNSVHELRDASIAGDTVRGRRMPENTVVAIPVTEIRSVQVRRFSGRRTALLVGGASVAAILFLAAGFAGI